MKISGSTNAVTFFTSSPSKSTTSSAEGVQIRCSGSQAYQANAGWPLARIWSGREAGQVGETRALNSTSASRPRHHSGIGGIEKVASSASISRIASRSALDQASA